MKSWALLHFVTLGSTFYVENNVNLFGKPGEATLISESGEDVRHLRVKELRYSQEEGFDGQVDSSEEEKNNDKKACAIMVLSNSQNPSMQSLVRRYRYDANGILIPSSVRYFIKLPQGSAEPRLVRLNDRAFTPLGGFVRYYKEVPPIPQIW